MAVNQTCNSRDHSILILHQIVPPGLAPLTDGVALWDTPESATLPGKTLWGYPPWCDAAWAMRGGSCLDPAEAGGLRVLRREEAESGVAPGAPAPCLSLDRERGTLAVVTPRTCGGFAPSGRLDAGPLSFEILESQNAPTTLWVSSIDGSPIKRSSRLLLTHLTGHRVAEVPFSFADGALHFRIHTD